MAKAHRMYRHTRPACEMTPDTMRSIYGYYQELMRGRDGRYDEARYHVCEVLSEQYGCSVDKVIDIINTRPWYKHEQQNGHEPLMPDAYRHFLYSLMRRFEIKRMNGEMEPWQPARIGRVHKDKYGVQYKASKAQAQQSAYLQDHASIDCYGNLVVDGQIVYSQWLQSFDNYKKRAQKEAIKHNQRLHEALMEDEDEDEDE